MRCTVRSVVEKHLQPLEECIKALLQQQAG
jgi:hypothetical protein